MYAPFALNTLHRIGVLIADTMCGGLTWRYEQILSDQSPIPDDPFVKFARVHLTSIFTIFAFCRDGWFGSVLLLP